MYRMSIWTLIDMPDADMADMPWDHIVLGPIDSNMKA